MCVPSNICSRTHLTWQKRDEVVVTQPLLSLLHPHSIFTANLGWKQFLREEGEKIARPRLHPSVRHSFCQSIRLIKGLHNDVAGLVISWGTRSVIKNTYICPVNWSEISLTKQKTWIFTKHQKTFSRLVPSRPSSLSSYCRLREPPSSNWTSHLPTIQCSTSQIISSIKWCFISPSFRFF